MRGGGGASKDEPEHKVTRVDLVPKWGREGGGIGKTTCTYTCTL